MSLALILATTLANGKLHVMGEYLNREGGGICRIQCIGPHPYTHTPLWIFLQIQCHWPWSGDLRYIVTHIIVWFLTCLPIGREPSDFSVCYKLQGIYITKQKSHHSTTTPVIRYAMLYNFFYFFDTYSDCSQLLSWSGVGNNVYSMLSVSRNICQFLDSLILTFCLNNNFSYLAQSILNC